MTEILIIIKIISYMLYEDYRKYLIENISAIHFLGVVRGDLKRKSANGLRNGDINNSGFTRR